MAEKKKRWSANQKSEIIMKLLRGETLENLSRENQIPISSIVEWRDKFIEGGNNSLKARPEDNPELVEYQKLLGQTQMELELLKKKKTGKNH